MAWCCYDTKEVAPFHRSTATIPFCFSEQGGASSGGVVVSVLILFLGFGVQSESMFPNKRKVPYGREPLSALNFEINLWQVVQANETVCNGRQLLRQDLLRPAKPAR